MAAIPLRPILWFALRVGGLIALCLFLLTKAPSTVERDRLDMHGVVLQLDEIGSVAGIELAKDVFYEGILKDIAALSSIRTVCLKQLSCSDELFFVIADLPNLRSLTCQGCTVSDNQLAMLKNSQLQAVDLSDTTGPIDGLAALGQQPSLSSMAFHGCRWFADDDLRLLPSFPMLKDIDISKTSVTDDGLAPLRLCAELSRVELSCCDQLSGASLRQLEFCKTLKSIGIHEVPVALSAAAEFRAACPKVDLAYDEILAPDFVLLMREHPTAQVTTGMSIESRPSPAASSLIQSLTMDLNSACDVSILKHLSQIAELRLTGPGVDDSVLACMATMKNLTTLDLSRSHISDSAFSGMPVFTELASVILVDTQVSVATLRWLATLPKLESLDLSGTTIAESASGEMPALALGRVSLVDTQISTATLRWLASFPKLRSLNLSGATIVESAIDAKMSFSALNFLDLTGANFAKNMLAHLNVPVLNELRLGACELNDADLSWLAAYSSLRTLDLSGNRLEGYGLGSLRGVPLIFLRLESCGLDDSSLNSLAAYPKLQALDLSENPLEGHGLESLRDVPLTHLRMYHSGLTDAGLEKASFLKGLQRLDVSGTTISGTGFWRCSELPIYLIKLDGTTLSSEGIDAICTLKGLNSINLQNAELPEETLQALENKLQRKRVSLDGMSEDYSAVGQPDVVAQIEFLILDRPDKEILFLMEKFPELHHITLTRCDVDEEAAKLIILAPKCTHISLNECTISNAATQTFASSKTLQSIWLSRMDATQIDIESWQRLNPQIHVGLHAMNSSTVVHWSDW